MTLDNQSHIPVLNYNQSPVVVKTHYREYLISPAEDDNQPSMMPLTMSEIEFINSNAPNTFRSGLLRFPAEIEAAMYSRLHILNWEEILTNQQIQDILIHPTMEGLQKLIDINSSTDFERVRGLLTKLKNSGEDRISIRVDRVIQTRYRELLNRQSKTSIVLSAKDDSVTAAPSPDVMELERKLEEAQRQLAELQSNQNMPSKPSQSTPGKPGRPKKKNDSDIK